MSWINFWNLSILFCVSVTFNLLKSILWHWIESGTVGLPPIATLNNQLAIWDLDPEWSPAPTLVSPVVLLRSSFRRRRSGGFWRRCLRVKEKKNRTLGQLVTIHAGGREDRPEAMTGHTTHFTLCSVLLGAFCTYDTCPALPIRRHGPAQRLLTLDTCLDHHPRPPPRKSGLSLLCKRVCRGPRFTRELKHLFSALQCTAVSCLK